MLLCLSRGSDGVLVAAVLGLSGGVLRSLLGNRPQGPAGVSVTARDGIARLARQLMAGSIRRAAVACAEELIGGQAIAARIACEQRTARQGQGERSPVP